MTITCDPRVEHLAGEILRNAAAARSIRIEARLSDAVGIAAEIPLTTAAFLRCRRVEWRAVDGPLGRRFAWVGDLCADSEALLDASHTFRHDLRHDAGIGKAHRFVADLLMAVVNLMCEMGPLDPLLMPGPHGDGRYARQARHLIEE